MKSVFDLGFDGVECIMSVEEAFNIKISDRDAELLRSEDELSRYVATRVQATPSEGESCPSAAAFYRLRRRVGAGGIKTNASFRPSASTMVLLGEGNRREQWAKLRDRLQLPLPSLCFGPVVGSIAIALMILSWPAGFYLGWKYVDQDSAAGFAFGAFVATMTFFALIFSMIFTSHRWRRSIPHTASTIGELAYLEFFQTKKAHPAPRWTEAEVCAAVRFLVAQSSGLPVQPIRHETTFMELNAITG